MHKKIEMSFLVFIITFSAIITSKFVEIYYENSPKLSLVIEIEIRKFNPMLFLIPSGK